MIDPRPPQGQSGPPPPRTRLISYARAMFEPGAVGLLHNDPIDEGARMIALAVYGLRGAQAIGTDELVEWVATMTWFAARRQGFTPAHSATLVEAMAGTVRRQITPADAR